MSKYGNVKRNSWLDFVRSLAIFFVLISHAYIYLLPHWPSAGFLKFGGYVGVEIFFVLSGFLIGKIINSLASDWNIDTIKNFWIRRWLRTLPNYFFFLGICAFLAFFMIRPSSLEGWPLYLFFLQNLFNEHPQFFGEAWSLSVEEIFYLIFPLIIFLFRNFFKFSFRKSIILAVFLVVFGSTSFRLFLALQPEIMWDVGIRKVVGARLDGIGFGVLTALMLPCLSARMKKYLAFLLLPGLFFSIFYVGLLSIDELNNSIFARTALFTLTSLGAVGLILFGMQWEMPVIFGKLSNFFAKISYSAYLCNLSIMATLDHFWSGDGRIKFLWFFILVIVFSYIAYLFIELRFMRWRDKNFPAERK